MAFPLRRVAEPSSEPVSLSDMKLHLKVDFDDDDDLISALISTARERAEDLTGRCLISQQWTFAMDQFPCWHHFHRDPFHNFHSKLWADGPNCIILPRGPVLSIDSITYTDPTGAAQTLDESKYRVDLLSEPARILPARNSTWPLTNSDVNSAVITFTCGYEQIPKAFIHAIKLIASSWYESRAEVTQGGGNFNSLPMPLSAQSLLSTYELFVVGYPSA